MVSRDDRGAGSGHVLDTRYVHAEVQAQEGRDDRGTNTYSGRDTPFSRAKRWASSLVTLPRRVP